MIITLDGPTASGKSTVGYKLAQQINGLYLNTGLFYRFLGFCALQQGFTCEQFGQLSLAQLRYYLDREYFDYCYTNGHPTVLYNSCDITHELKSAPIDQAASCIALNKHARKCVIKYQRAYAEHTPLLIADGRDCGTQAFPHADYKFFITATLEVRAERWRTDQAKRGFCFTLQESIACIQERDTRDSTRDHAPLMPAPDAYTIDTTTLTIDQVVDHIRAIIHAA